MARDRVGIIGPGRMGLAMLKHLKRHGFEVTAYDVNDEQLATDVSEAMAGLSARLSEQATSVT